MTPLATQSLETSSAHVDLSSGMAQSRYRAPAILAANANDNAAEFVWSPSLVSKRRRRAGRRQVRLG